MTSVKELIGKTIYILLQNGEEVLVPWGQYIATKVVDVEETWFSITWDEEELMYFPARGWKYIGADLDGPITVEII